MTKVDKYKETKQNYDKQYPTIRLEKSVKDELYTLGRMGDKPSDVIKVLIDFYKSKHK